MAPQSIHYSNQIKGGYLLMSFLSFLVFTVFFHLYSFLGSVLKSNVQEVSSLCHH